MGSNEADTRYMENDISDVYFRKRSHIAARMMDQGERDCRQEVILVFQVTTKCLNTAIVTIERGEQLQQIQEDSCGHRRWKLKKRLKNDSCDFFVLNTILKER